MPEVWATTDFSEMPNTRAMPALLRPCAMSARTSRRRVSELLGVVAAGEHRRDHLRVERDAALGHPA